MKKFIFSGFLILGVLHCIAHAETDSSSVTNRKKNLRGLSLFSQRQSQLSNGFDGKFSDEMPSRFLSGHNMSPVFPAGYRSVYLSGNGKPFAFKRTKSGGSLLGDVIGGALLFGVGGWAIDRIGGTNDFNFGTWVCVGAGIGFVFHFVGNSSSSQTRLALNRTFASTVTGHTPTIR